jgi:hypothetical protein
MHSCPLLENDARTAPSAARSRVGVSQHEHGVLAAELQRRANEPLAGLLADQPADCC